MIKTKTQEYAEMIYSITLDVLSRKITEEHWVDMMQMSIQKLKSETGRKDLFSVSEIKQAGIDGEICDIDTNHICNILTGVVKLT